MCRYFGLIQLGGEILQCVRLTTVNLSQTAIVAKVFLLDLCLLLIEKNRGAAFTGQGEIMPYDKACLKFLYKVGV